jgi:hypothetical protein
MVYGAILYACPTEVVANNCPWQVKLLLKHTAKDVLEGTIEASGGIKRVSNLQTFETQYVPFNGSGKIVFRKDDSAK